PEADSPYLIDAVNIFIGLCKMILRQQSTGTVSHDHANSVALSLLCSVLSNPGPAVASSSRFILHSQKHVFNVLLSTSVTDNVQILSLSLTLFRHVYRLYLPYLINEVSVFSLSLSPPLSLSIHFIVLSLPSIFSLILIVESYFDTILLKQLNAKVAYFDTILLKQLNAKDSPPEVRMEIIVAIAKLFGVQQESDSSMERERERERERQTETDPYLAEEQALENDMAGGRLLVDLYVNYDSVLARKNLFERIISSLSAYIKSLPTTPPSTVTDKSIRVILPRERRERERERAAKEQDALDGDTVEKSKLDKERERDKLPKSSDPTDVVLYLTSPSACALVSCSVHFHC
ncbi:hypothetical protein KIPB_010294, partial [Kipferlia bialata]